MSGDRYTIKDNEAIHFITFTAVAWVDLFTRPTYKTIIIEALNHCVQEKGLLIYSWAIMTSHVHLLITSKASEDLPSIIRDFKKFTSKKLISAVKEIPESRREWLLHRFEYEAAGKHQFKVWQNGYHGIECDGTIICAEEKLEYIHQNPVEELIVFRAEDYVCSSAAAYAGDNSLVQIEFLNG